MLTKVQGDFQQIVSCGCSIKLTSAQDIAGMSQAKSGFSNSQPRAADSTGNNTLPHQSDLTCICFLAKVRKHPELQRLSVHVCPPPLGRAGRAQQQQSLYTHNIIVTHIHPFTGFNCKTRLSYASRRPAQPITYYVCDTTRCLENPVPRMIPRSLSLQ